MLFIRTGNVYKVIQITGPRHNLLAIEFCPPGEMLNAIIESLPPNGNEPKLLLSQVVQQNVMEGVAQANREFSTNYNVKRIQFIPTDSPPYKTYRYLARGIVERLFTGLPFMKLNVADSD